MRLTREPVRCLLVIVLLATLAKTQSDPADVGRHRDPDAARLVTRDIDNFWRAYDKAGPNNACEVFQNEYINKGNIGTSACRKFAPSVRPLRPRTYEKAISRL